MSRRRQLETDRHAGAVAPDRHRDGTEPEVIDRYRVPDDAAVNPEVAIGIGYVQHDPADPGVDEVVADWAKTKGAVGVRLMLREEQISDPTDPRLNRAFAAAGRHGVPVNFLCWGRLDDGAEVVRRNPDTVIVIDHLGLLQPNEPPPLAEPWADLPKLLALGPSRMSG